MFVCVYVFVCMCLAFLYAYNGDFHICMHMRIVCSPCIYVYVWILHTNTYMCVWFNGHSLHAVSPSFTGWLDFAVDLTCL